MRIEVTPRIANLASIWANQTLALLAQNSESLTAAALMSKVAEETAAGGSDIIRRRRTGAEKEGTVYLKTRGKPVWREQGLGTNQHARESCL